MSRKALCRVRFTLTLVSVLCLDVAVTWGNVCENDELKKAVQIINRACTRLTCNFDELEALDRRVDKKVLFAAMREIELKPVHLFFPINEWRVEEVFDWTSSKKDLVNSLKLASNLEDSAIFVLGRASTVGDEDYNRRLSIKRMKSVLDYLEGQLGIRCRAFFGGYFGEVIMQLNRSEASSMGIDSQDFRNDEMILNQSVHIFVFPCPDLL